MERLKLGLECPEKSYKVLHSVEVESLSPLSYMTVEPGAFRRADAILRTQEAAYLFNCLERIRAE